MSADKFTSFISEYTRGHDLSHWQIAQNGVWEDAYPISAEPDESEVSAILEYIRKADNDIALEGFFKKSEDQFLFFGVRIEKYSTEEKLEIVSKILEFSKSADKEFDSFIRYVNAQVIFGDILQKRPDFLEVGAEGFWKSYGSIVVWKKENTQALSPDDISIKAPQILEPFKRSMMLELAYDSPAPHWLGLSLSRKDTDEQFNFDEARYIQLTGNITENT